jgi:hypothetical protein
VISLLAALIHTQRQALEFSARARITSRMRGTSFNALRVSSDAGTLPMGAGFLLVVDPYAG